MKSTVRFSEGAVLLFIFIFLVLSLPSFGQETPKVSASLPDRISKIVSVSCMPCHSSTGGMLSKAKLNFTEWGEYSLEKQQKKSAQMYKELKKSAMPPKDVRENNPGIIPTGDQISIIKSWADSLDAVSN
jgi:hypothetical protein